MRVLFLGDIVGRIARNEVIKQLPGLRDELALDFVVVNCENAAGGFGITPKICEALRQQQRKYPHLPAWLVLLWQCLFLSLMQSR